MTVNERLLDKVRNLLETTIENGATAEESQSAIALAQKLMAKHNLEIADVEAVEGAKEVDPVTGVAMSGKKMNWWAKLLASAVARNFRCKTYLQTGMGKTSVIFLGEPNDVEIAKSVYTFALQQIEHYAKQYRRKRRNAYKKENGGTEGFDGIAIRNDYMQGYIKGLEDKLKEQLDENEEYALIVQTPNSVIKAYNEMSLRSQRVGSRSAGDGQARTAGYERGQKFASPAGSIEG